ncbi:MAG: tRNA 2-thiouridine(34) synthase MnmA [Anaerolineales bacterium]|nr:tRNA 2-thiouridine(34) synthase MnmA [Chloroflexota bacterium]MBL6982598.1 tRNA 2-thiouridine(34) synthase MnmA [Anaerolineales bacterium]
MKKKTVVVAMSGGVDSSVTAALLKEQGYDVIGMMMRLWSEPGSEAENRCCTVDAMNLARRMAAQLEIPFYAIDAKDVFRKTVVQYFFDGYRQGITPNPCLVCNMHIRWEFLLNRALALGADFMATGHYARLLTADGGRQTAVGSPRSSSFEAIRLQKALDENKDQSYVLHVLKQDQLKHALFPLGDYTKPQVRDLARKFDLPVAERSDSQDLCFLGNGTYAEFLERNAPEVNRPGPMLNSAGEEIGQHRGLAYYTIGQRRGLGIAAPEPLYVIQKDNNKNSLLIGPKESLGRKQLTAREANWISGSPPESPFRAQIKIRYKADFAWGLVTPQSNNGFQIEFDEQLRDITPGQAAVIYNEDICLGGGIIE